MRKYVAALIALAFATATYGQSGIGGIAARAFPQAVTASQLPAATGTQGLRRVTDALTTTSCTVGGGANVLICFDNGAWVPLISSTTLPVASDDQTASEVAMTDAGGYFTTDNVEAALQQVGPTMTNARTPSSTLAHAASHAAGVDPLDFGVANYDSLPYQTSPGNGDCTGHTGESMLVLDEDADGQSDDAYWYACLDDGGGEWWYATTVRNHANSHNSDDDPVYARASVVGALIAPCPPGKISQISDGLRYCNEAGNAWIGPLPTSATAPAGAVGTLQYNLDGTAFGSVTGSVVSGANVTLAGTLQMPWGSAAANAIHFGVPGTGISTRHDSVWDLTNSGIVIAEVRQNAFCGTARNGVFDGNANWGCLVGWSSRTQPSILPNGVFDQATGLGSGGTSEFSLIANNVEQLRVTTAGLVLVPADTSYIQMRGVDTNWRMGTSNATGGVYIARDKATSHVQYVHYGPTSGQGFVVGNYANGAALEIESASRVVYFHTGSQHKPLAAPPWACEAGTEATTYYDSDDHDFCDCVGAVPTWRSRGGAGACT